eukprot:scaffold649739_cov45-Prasinocladus_malaysianus.AAC.1
MLGIRRTERVLPVGTVVTAIGELREKPPLTDAAAKAANHAMAYSLQKPQSGGSVGPFYVTT